MEIMRIEAGTHAISGIDLALWDILGQVTGQPVGRLLGGTYRTKVKPYASLLMDAPEVMAEELRGLGDEGRHVDGRRRRQRRLLAQHLQVRAAHRRDVGVLRRGLVRGAARPDALEDFAQLRLRSPVPIAGGETLTRRQAFQPWLEARAFDVVQPDVTKVGGLSEQRRIAWTAQDHGVAFVGHGWNTAIGLAADLQMAAALPNTELVEFKTGSPYNDELAGPCFALDDDGLLAIPDGPGLGIALDPDAVARYTGDAWLLAA